MVTLQVSACFRLLATCGALLGAWSITTAAEEQKDKVDSATIAAALGKTHAAGVVTVEQWLTVPNRSRIAAISGFFVEEDSADEDWVLTAISDYRRTDTFRIEWDRNMLPAELIAFDAETGLGLLSLESHPNRTALKIAGETPAKIGTPLFVLNPSATANAPASLARLAGKEVLEGSPSLLRIHAMAFEGMSGAPLIGANESVIAMVLRPMPLTTDGVLLAHRAETLTQFVESVKRFQRPEKPWLGIKVDLASNAPKVIGISEDSPAVTAGIKAEDIVLSLGKATILSTQDLIDAAALLSHDKEVEIKVLRGLDIETLRITPRLAPRP